MMEEKQPRFLVNWFNVTPSIVLAEFGLNDNFLNGILNDWTIIKQFEWGELGWDPEEGFRFHIDSTKESLTQCISFVNNLLSKHDLTTRDCLLDVTINVWPKDLTLPQVLKECNVNEKGIYEDPNLFRCECCDKWYPKEKFVTGAGVCKKCEEEGYWMDPIGTVHFPGSDPAAAYE